MNTEALTKQCLEIMATAPAVTITSIGPDGYPRTRGMLNLRNREQYPDHVHLYASHDRDLMVFISTNTSSQKRGEIERNPRVCLYYSHPERFLGVCLVGNVEIVEDLALKRAVWVDGWERYFRETGTPGDPDFTLLRVFPFEARGWLAEMTFQFAVPS
jgi:pyridoxamine 5'-phosphate oxidase